MTNNHAIDVSFYNVAGRTLEAYALDIMGII